MRKISEIEEAWVPYRTKKWEPTEEEDIPREIFKDLKQLITDNIRELEYTPPPKPIKKCPKCGKAEGPMFEMVATGTDYISPFESKKKIQAKILKDIFEITEEDLK